MNGCHDLPRASVALLPTMAAARQARRFVVETLEGWQLASVIERAELLVSELVSNAIRHAGSGSRVVLVDGPAWVRIEVSDHGGGGAVVRTPGVDDVGGRGLLLVQKLADRGVRPSAAASTSYGVRSRNDESGARPRRACMDQYMASRITDSGIDDRRG